MFPDVRFVIFEPNCPCCIRHHRRRVNRVWCVVVLVDGPKSAVHTGHKSKMARKKVQYIAECCIVQMSDGYHLFVLFVFRWNLSKLLFALCIVSPWLIVHTYNSSRSDWNARQRGARTEAIISVVL